MKKLLTCILVVTLCLCYLASCDFSLKHEHIKGEWEYNSTQHWQSVTCTWNMCDINITSEDHTDDIDGNLFCDVCGFEMSIPSWDIEWQHSETHHWWVPKGETAISVVYGFGEHENFDADLYCDVCGYPMVEPPSPTNHFLRNQAGCEWLNEITVEDIVGVKIIEKAVGVAPGALNISTSINKTVIVRLFSDYYWLDTSPIPKEEGSIDGGSTVIVKFILKNETVKELQINNGNYCDINGNCFDLLDIPRFEDGEDYVNSYGLNIYQGYGTIYDANDNAICSIPMDEIEFIKVADDIVLDTKPITHYIETEFGKMYFLSESYFYIEGIVEGGPWSGTQPLYFQLSGKTLDELIHEYTIVNE